jgi:hypothetical protein
MSQAEAEVFVGRELAGWSRSYVAETIDKSVSTVDNQHQSAKQKARMPEITKVDSHKRASDDRVVDIWFANDARLRYRATDSDPERSTILEETFRADDPHSVWDTADLVIDPDELHEVALESISRYLEDYRNDFEAAQFDWSNLFEALTCHEA